MIIFCTVTKQIVITKENVKKYKFWINLNLLDLIKKKRHYLFNLPRKITK